MTPTNAQYGTETEDADQQQPAPPDYGPKNRDLPGSLKNAILSAIKEAQTQEKFVRRKEIFQDAEHRFYDMGIQHICCVNDGYQQATPGGSYTYNGNQLSFGEYLDDYNIFTAFALIQRAKLTEALPPIDFQPIDPNEPDDIEAANAAEGMRHDLDRNIDIKDVQQSIIYHLQMGGRAVMWTRIDEKPEDFGVNPSGQSKRGSKVTVYGCLEAKVPIYITDQADFWYQILYDDPDIKTARTEYDWIADEISAGETCLAENNYERTLRLGILQGAQGGRYGLRVGDSISHLVSRCHAFLRLSAFQQESEAFTNDDGGTETIEDEDGARAKSIKEKLAEVFPHGVHATVVGKQYAEAIDQSMDDCLSVENSYIGKGQSRMPIMRPMVIVQDRFNTSMNLFAETNDFCVPSTWVACDAQEYAAIKKQKSQPGAFRNLKSLPTGVKITDCIYVEKGQEIPSSFKEYLELMYSTIPQFQLAVPPSIWGEAMKDQKTSSGYQLAAVQAMGVLGAFWQAETRMLARMYYHNCLAIMNDSEFPDEVTVTVDGKNVVVKKESLTKGDFRAFPDTESGFPETTAAKRSTLERVVTMLAASPLAAQIYGSPDNVAAMVRVEGLGDTLVIPEAQSRNKQLREIEILLSQSPIFGDQMLVTAMAQGADIPTMMQTIKAAQDMAAQAYQAQMVPHAAEAMAAQAQRQPDPPMPPPPDPASIARSSVTVWESDYHVWEAKKCRDWLSSDDCNRELTLGRPGSDGMAPNIAGILNVILHMKEHDMYAAQQAPPVSGPLPAPTMAPGAPGVLPPPPKPAPAAPPGAVM